MQAGAGVVADWDPALEESSAQQGRRAARRCAGGATHDEEATCPMSIQSPQGSAGWCGARSRATSCACSGDAAATYLQGQCSQDIDSLAVGASAWTFVLQPSGKVDVLRVTRLADGFVLDTDGGYGDALVNRLRRFHFRTKATSNRSRGAASLCATPVPAS